MMYETCAPFTRSRAPSTQQTTRPAPPPPPSPSRVIDTALLSDKPLDLGLLVGGSGTGKSTVAAIIANEMGVDVYQVEAPISSTPS